METVRCPGPERLMVYTGGACSDNEARHIAAHLTICEGCRAFVEQERSNLAWLSEIPAPEVAGADPPTEVKETVGSARPVQPGNRPQLAVSERLEIKGYELQAPLGRGGQSQVYRAVQESTRQEVAIKVPHESQYLTNTERQRFEREITLIAQFRHPHIISIFDSGITEDGRKYYVMDYVPGLHLDKYVLDQDLSLEETLDLFAVICDAVQYAHRRGVMHRDLKPLNIIVDGHGNPRILDFGLARSVASSGDSVVSLQSQLLGTVRYMSPEQTGGNPERIDTRTDVYSLGLILYELLTGGRPYDITGNLREDLATIAHTDPRLPRQEWDPAAGGRRSAKGRRRSRRCPIGQDLQTIILTALLKEPDQRYQSAGELAEDIRRHLAELPPKVPPMGLWYHIKKLLWRYRAVAAVAASFLLLMLLSLVVTLSLWRQSEFRLGAVDKLLTNELGNLEGAEIDQALRAMSQFQRLAGTEETKEALQTMQRRLDEFERAVLVKLEDALADNRITLLSRVLSSDDAAVEAVLSLDQRADGHEIVRRLIARLEGSIIVPPPLGYGQRTLDMMEALELLGPGNPSAATARRELAELTRWPEELVVHGLPAPADEHRTGAGGWEIDEPHEHNSEGHLRLMSTVANHVSAKCAFTPLTSTTIARVKLRIDPPEKQDHPGGTPDVRELQASVQLLEDHGRGLGWSVRYGRQTADFLAADGPSSSLPFAYGTDYEVEIRHFGDRNSCDLLVDGTYLTEEAPCPPVLGPVRLVVGTNTPAVLTLKECEVYSLTHSIKRQIGAITPVMRDHRLRLRPTCLLPDCRDRYTTRQAPGSAGAEVVAIDLQRADELRFFALHSDLFSITRTASYRLPDDSYVRALANVDGVPAIVIFNQYAPQADAHVIESRVVHLDTSWDVHVRFIHHDNAKDAAYVRSATGSDRLAVGLRGGSGARGLDWYEVTGVGSEACFTYRGLQPLSLPLGQAMAALPPSDVVNLEACDINGDGSDEVLVGLGQWHGNVPAVVQPDESLALAHPLTDPGRPLGETQVALARAANGAEFLIAASKATKRNEDDSSIVWTREHGLRVWRVADLAAAPRDLPYWQSVSPVWEDVPRNIQGVATGRLAGRTVVAVCVACEPQELKNSQAGPAILRLYDLGDGDLQLLWSAALYDAKMAHDSGRPCLFDLNNDGNDELIVPMPDTGLLVFAYEP